MGPRCCSSQHTLLPATHFVCSLNMLPMHIHRTARIPSKYCKDARTLRGVKSRVETEIPQILGKSCREHPWTQRLMTIVLRSAVSRSPLATYEASFQRRFIGHLGQRFQVHFARDSCVAARLTPSRLGAFGTSESCHGPKAW